MKRGTTPTLEIKLELNATNVTNVYFTFKEKVEDSDEFLLQKNYPEDATYDDEKEVFLLPLTQEDTLALTDTYFLEAEVVIGGKSVIKSDIGKEIMQPTLYTEVISGNESNGESDTITLTFTDYVEGGGSGGTTNYNELSNKPRFNGIEWVGNKTDSDMGIATKGELQTKADKSDTYTKSETDNLLSAKQNTITGGNGIDVSSDVVSVDIIQGSYLGFENGKLFFYSEPLGHNKSFRQYLVDTAYQNPLASKQYVDNLMSGAVKRLVVQTLPTDNIDTNTIYMILKSVPTTNNIYDEYMYINNAWELIGSTEVDLSNYYTKTESNTKFQDKLTAGANITISSNNVISASGGGSYSSGNGIDITNDTISVSLVENNNCISFQSGKLAVLGSDVATDVSFKATMPYDTTIRQALTTGTNSPLQPKLTAGTNITIDSNNVISASGGGLSYTFTDGLAESSGTVGIDLASGSKLLIDANDKLDVDLSSKQDTIDSTHKLSADNVDDTNTTNKFVSANEKQTWNAKADNTTISTDTSSTTVSLTLADNHEYRYTQDLTSLTLTMPNGDFISSIVFASGSTPTSMTYDSNIKWSGDDITNGQFVPSADKDYDICLYYNGLNVNGIVRGVS